MADAAKITAEDLKAAIAQRYEWPEWHVQSEVTLALRRLDVVAFNLWGARGYRIVGFEIKVSRGDWLRELAAFQKSEEWMQVVDAFYVVTPPKLVKEDELPADWGHLEFTGAKMMTRRVATSRKGATTIPREVAARFFTQLGNAARTARQNAEWQLADREQERVKKVVTERLERDYKERFAGSERSLEDYHQLLKALGVESHGWRPFEAAMKAAAAFVSAKGDLNGIRQRLDQTIGALNQRVLQMRQLSEDLGKLELPNG
jgi:hypothetical protein